jgi:hypothetical protein
VLEGCDGGADVFGVDGKIERIGADDLLLDLAGECFGWGWVGQEVVEGVATWGCGCECWLLGDGLLAFFPNLRIFPCLACACARLRVLFLGTKKGRRAWCPGFWTQCPGLLH